MERDLGGRLFKFAVEVIKFLLEIKNTPEVSIIKYQLTKAATSSGANYEESQAASSRADFKNKVNISLREMREAAYWMKIIKELGLGNKVNCSSLINEAEELKKILGSITSKVKAI